MKLTRISSEDKAVFYTYFDSATFMKIFNTFLKEQNISTHLNGEFDKDPILGGEASLFTREPYIFQYIGTKKGVMLTMFSGDVDALLALREEFSKYMEKL